MSAGDPGDVRMRGFRTRVDVETAQAWVDAQALPTALESVALTDAAGRLLAEDVVSDEEVPPFPRAAMDGWALRGADTFGASGDDPVELGVVGRALPGAPWLAPIGAGEALRIMTGAPVPEGADAVLRAEDGEERAGRLEVRGAVPPGRHVGARGEDIRAGQRLLERGRRLRPQDLGVAASIGRTILAVARRPQVTLLITGDEVLAPGEPPRAGRIRDANGPMLKALIERDGGVVQATTYVPDGRDEVERALVAAAGDVVLVSGGSSVGEEDHAPRILADLGELAFHGVALRPASPSGAGRLATRLVFLLPGNPVSCLSGYDFFAGRVIRRAAHGDAAWPYVPHIAPLAHNLASGIGRVDYARVRLESGRVVPTMSRGASILTSTTEADGFVVVPRDREGWPEGTPVTVWLY